MCLNQYVSLNTFLFGIFGLLLIAMNNKYSQYKLPFFNNSYAYLFMLSFIIMQFFEFILWRNLDNFPINHIVSLLGFLLLTIQPITSLLLLDNIPFRNNLLLMYSIPTFIFAVYNIFTTNIHTVLSPSGHLYWKWTSYKNNLLRFLVIPFYCVFLFFPLLYNKYYNSLLILLLYFLAIYFFGKDGSSGSIWCLSVNSIILFFCLQILVVMPFKEIQSNKA